jgi:hypothetical protein
MDDSMLRIGSLTVLLAVWITRGPLSFNAAYAGGRPPDSRCAKLWQKEKQNA